MNGKSDNYNLLTEPWIPVLWADGKFSRVGIKEALTQADRIRQIAASNPMDRVAILRFLLAVLYWCKGSPPDETSTTSSEPFPASWFSKLDSERERFDLVSGTDGFYQDNTVSGGAGAVSYLLQDLPSGTNIAHFRHTRDGREGLCLACCAMGLLRWSCAAPAGTKGMGVSMTAHLNGQTPTYTFPDGGNLLASLASALPTEPDVLGDNPIWAGATQDSPLGYLKGLTWRSRCIVLAPPDSSGTRAFFSGKCCYCGGDTDRLVRSLIFQPGWTRPSKEPWANDPGLLRLSRVVGKRDKRKTIVPSWPGPSSAVEGHASVWRSVVEAMLQGLANGLTAPRSRTATLLGSSNELIKHAAELQVELPAIGRDTAARLLTELTWLRQITWTAASSRRGDWGSPPKGQLTVKALCAAKAKGHAVRSALCERSPSVEPELERAFQALVRQCSGSEMDAGVTQWRQTVTKILDRMGGQVANATASGSPLRRREALLRTRRAVREAAAFASVTANRRLTEEAIEQPVNPKNGGDK